MIDGSEKRNRQLAFERRNSHVCEKRSKFIIKQFERSVRSLNVFQHSKRNFVSLRGHVISSIYSSSKLKTKLELISRYHEVREIAETSQKTANLHTQSCPITSACFKFRNTLGHRTTGRGPLGTRLRWVGSNLGKAKIIILSSSNKLENKAKKSKWSRDILN